MTTPTETSGGQVLPEHARTVRAGSLRHYVDWRLPVGTAMETLTRVDQHPTYARLYIRGEHGDRSAGIVRPGEEVTLYDPTHVPEGVIFTVLVRTVAHGLGASRRAVFVRPWGTDPTQHAAKVLANELAADETGSVKVWEGMYPDVPPARRVPAGQAVRVQLDEAARPAGTDVQVSLRAVLDFIRGMDHYDLAPLDGVEAAEAVASAVELQFAFPGLPGADKR